MTVSGLWLFLAVPWVGLQCLIVVFPNLLTYFLLYMYHYMLRLMFLAKRIKIIVDHIAVTIYLVHNLDSLKAMLIISWSPIMCATRKNRQEVFRSKVFI